MFIILDYNENEALSLRKKLYHHYIHSIVISPNEIERIRDYPAHAIILPRVETLADPEGLCASLRDLYPHLPLAILYRPTAGNYYAYARMVDIILEERATTPKTIGALYDIYRQKGNQSPESRIVDCLRTDSRVRGCVYLLSRPFPARKTAWMLARYLTLAAPRAVPAAELLVTCFPPQSERSARVIRRHLSELDGMFKIGFGIRMFACERPAAYYIRKQEIE